METPVRRFLLRLGVTTGVLAVAGTLLFRFFLLKYYTPALPFLLIFMAGFTFLTFTRLLKTADKGLGAFSRANMLVTMIRLLLFAAIAVFYFLTIKQNGPSFVICLGILYLIFTSLEVSELTRYLRSTANQGKKSTPSGDDTLSGTANRLSQK